MALFIIIVLAIVVAGQLLQNPKALENLAKGIVAGLFLIAILATVAMIGSGPESSHSPQSAVTSVAPVIPYDRSSFPNVSEETRQKGLDMLRRGGKL